MDVFVNGAAAPSLSVEDLSPQKSGGVALFVGNGSDGAFSGLRVKATAPPGPVPASTQDVFRASATGNLARVRTLVEADPRAANARNPMGMTPLHMAVRFGQRAVAEYLVSKGTDANAVARHAGTPLDVAAEAGQQAFSGWPGSRGARLTPIRFDVTQLSPNLRRVAFPWGMRNNVVVLSGVDGAVVVDSGVSTRAVVAMIGIVRKDLGEGRTVEQMVTDDVLKGFKGRFSLLELLTPDAFIPRVAAALKEGELK